jgi:transcriptional regulator with XRE-family HTH domain
MVKVFGGNNLPIQPNMEEQSIGQRIRFLMTGLNLKVSTFARALEVSETNIRNYLERGTKPSSDVLEKLANTFEQVNIVWVVTGKGDPFLPGASESTTSATTIEGKKNKGIQNTGNGNNTINNISLDSCKRDLASAHEKITLLTSQLADKERIIQLLERSGK